MPVAAAAGIGDYKAYFCFFSSVSGTGG